MGKLEIIVPSGARMQINAENFEKANALSLQRFGKPIEKAAAFDAGARFDRKNPEAALDLLPEKEKAKKSGIIDNLGRNLAHAYEGATEGRDADITAQADAAWEGQQKGKAVAKKLGYELAGDPDVVGGPLGFIGGQAARAVGEAPGVARDLVVGTLKSATNTIRHPWDTLTERPLEFAGNAMAAAPFLRPALGAVRSVPAAGRAFATAARGGAAAAPAFEVLPNTVSRAAAARTFLDHPLVDVAEAVYPKLNVVTQPLKWAARGVSRLAGRGPKPLEGLTGNGEAAPLTTRVEPHGPAHEPWVEHFREEPTPLPEATAHVAPTVEERLAALQQLEAIEPLGKTFDPETLGAPRGTSLADVKLGPKTIPPELAKVAYGILEGLNGPGKVPEAPARLKALSELSEGPAANTDVTPSHGSASPLPATMPDRLKALLEMNDAHPVALDHAPLDLEVPATEVPAPRAPWWEHLTDAIKSPRNSPRFVPPDMNHPDFPWSRFEMRGGGYDPTAHMPVKSGLTPEAALPRHAADPLQEALAYAYDGPTWTPPLTKGSSARQFARIAAGEAKPWALAEPPPPRIGPMGAVQPPKGLPARVWDDIRAGKYDDAVTGELEPPTHPDAIANGRAMPPPAPAALPPMRDVGTTRRAVEGGTKADRSRRTADLLGLGKRLPPRAATMAAETAPAMEPWVQPDMLGAPAERPSPAPAPRVVVSDASVQEMLDRPNAWRDQLWHAARERGFKGLSNAPTSEVAAFLKAALKR